MDTIANVFHTMSDETKKENVINRFKQMTDYELELLAKISRIREEHVHIFKDMMRQNENEFNIKSTSFTHYLKTGDVILVTGKSISSKILVNAQRGVYKNARSSHVAIVQEDFLCVDAMPEIGVSSRLISDILHDVEADWRIIRFNGLSSEQQDEMSKLCVYYLEQPYKIKPSKKPAKKFSYCSELVRKIFSDSKVIGSGIPNNIIIKPCDFDRIADNNSNWVDMTTDVKPFVDFCIEYDDIIRNITDVFTKGIALNRQRYTDRNNINNLSKKLNEMGVISDGSLSKISSAIKECESQLTYKFWDK
ncbi:YiiX/YebB-like N1pC/P60 family cysteine hydrolase [Aeromonas veronii]